MKKRDYFYNVHVAFCLAAFVGSPRLHADDSWRRPFEPDEHTVVLYHFDEGAGN